MAEADVERLLAYEEIRALIANYALAVDSRDLDALVALFVEDVNAGRYGTGRQALRRSFADSLSAVGITILHVTTQVINVTDHDRANGLVYCRAEIQDGERWLHQSILYTDSYACRAGEWLFVRRRHELFYGAEVGQNPLRLPLANWPEHHAGMGTIPERWPTWQEFWRNRRDSSATGGSA